MKKAKKNLASPKKSKVVVVTMNNIADVVLDSIVGPTEPCVRGPEMGPEDALHNVVNTQISLRNAESSLWGTIQAATRVMHYTPKNVRLANCIKDLLKVRKSLDKVSKEITPISRGFALRLAKKAPTGNQPVTFTELGVTTKTIG